MFRQVVKSGLLSGVSLSKYDDSVCFVYPKSLIWSLLMRRTRLLTLFILFVSLACSLVTPETPIPVKTPFPLTPFPRATRSAGTPTPNSSVVPPYTACHNQRRSPIDFTLFPAGGCPNERCVDAGLERNVYAAWKAEMMQRHELSESSFAEHIQLANLSVRQSGNEIVFRLDYVVINDWARTYQTDYINFKAEPDADAIAKAVQMAIFDTQISLPQVVSIETVETRFASCDPELEIDWCYLDYPNFGGRLYVTAFRIIDLEADQCMDAAIYLDTGELYYCRERPCMIDE